METRTQNVKRNIIFNIFKYIAQIVLQFVLRTALIYFLGIEYIGLNGLFSNIFAFLNLAELGVGSAIVFAMYKPIAENDMETVKALQNLYKKFYLGLALFILVVGGILTPFIKLFIKDGTPADVNIYILFLMYLFNAVVSYFCAHKRSLLLAFQRNDIENKVSTLCLFILISVQILVLFITKNFYAYFSVNIFTTILECILITVVTNKRFPQANGKGKNLDKSVTKSITKNVLALSMHKIGGAVVFATDNILISSFFGLVVLGVYTNYTFITNSLITLFALVITALTGSVGNLIASNDEKYTYEKFKQINFLFSILSAFCTICLFVLFQPFIQTWTQNSQYLLSISSVFFICLSFYFTKMRTGTQIFKDCAGLFWQDRWKPIAEAVINLVTSIILAKFIGINGIFLGTIISTLAAPFWVEPLVLYKHYFKRNVGSYFLRYIFDFVVMLGVGAVCYFVCSFIPTGGLWLLVAKFAACISLCAVLLILAYCWTKEFKESMVLLKQMLGFGKRKNK